MAQNWASSPNITVRLQLDAIFPDAFSHHLLRNKYLEGIDEGIQHPLTDVILPNIERNASLRQVISLYLSHISLLLLAKEREMRSISCNAVSA